MQLRETADPHTPSWPSLPQGYVWLLRLLSLELILAT